MMAVARLKTEPLSCIQIIFRVNPQFRLVVAIHRRMIEEVQTYQVVIRLFLVVVIPFTHFVAKEIRKDDNDESQNKNKIVSLQLHLCSLYYVIDIK